MSDKPLTLEQLRFACHIAARIVAKHGDRFLPVFARLHEELQLAEKNKTLHDIAIRMAEQFNGN